MGVASLSLVSGFAEMESACAEDVACRSFEGGALTVRRSLLLAVRSSEAEAGDGPGLAELVERVLVLLLLAVLYGATRVAAVEAAARVERRVGGMVRDCGVAVLPSYSSTAVLKTSGCRCDALLRVSPSGLLVANSILYSHRVPGRPF